MVSTMMPHDFPALFALRDRRHSDRMVILECHALLEEEPRHWQHWEPPSRLIGIHPVSQSRDHGFWLTEHPPSPRHHPHITIVLTRSRGSNYNDYRFRLRSWVLTGDYVFTQRFPIPVPVLHLDTDGAASVEGAIDDHFWFYTNHGSPVIRRDWYRYHNPRPIRRRSASSDDSDTDESEAEPRGRRARPSRDAQGAGHGAAAAPKPSAPEPTAIPAFVAAALATAAVSKGDTCPISMEPLATAVAIGVTSCFHVFDASSIAIWLTTSGGGCCPVCKQRCVLTLPPSCDAQGAGHRDPKPATAPGNSPALVEL